MKHRPPCRQSLLLAACVLMLSFFFSALTLSGCTAKKKPLSKTGFYFDTAITVTLYDPAKEALLDRCFALADACEKRFSRTLPGSDVWRINHAKGAPVTVSEDTVLLLKTALSYAKLTQGKVDPTVGKVSALWNFSGEIKGGGEKKPPTEAALREALSHVDYQKAEISGSSVTLADPEAQIDLGFIAKGFIADRMKELLLAEGVKSALINLGGNVLALGAKENGSPFQIGIQEPFAPQGTAAAVVPAIDLSVVSSGTYERYFEYGGELYHHILDTQTGYPVRNNLSSVTIFSASSMEGDALSTVCFTLGLEKGMALIESLPDVEAVFITEDGQLHGSSGAPL